MRILRVALLVGICGVYGCSSFGLPARQGMEQSYEVWSDFLEATFPEAETLLLLENLQEIPLSPEVLAHVSEGPSKEAMEDQVRGGPQKSLRTEGFGPGAAVKLITAGESKEQRTRRFQQYFQQTLNEAEELIQLSRVGFSHDSTVAYFSAVRHMAWHDCWEGGDVLMRKNDEGRWEILSKNNRFIVECL